MSALVHWVGPPVQIGPIRRQRCMWCGTLLDEVDLSRVAVPIPPGKTEEQARADGDLAVPTWEPGSWMGVDGCVRWIERTVEQDRELGPDARTPDESCCRIDPAVTA